MSAETRENVEAHALAGIGLIKGIGEAMTHGFQTPEPSESRSASAAIAAGIATVALWDRYAPETITNRVHRANHPVLAKSAVAYTALHLMNLLPESIDGFSQFAKRGWIKK